MAIYGEYVAFFKLFLLLLRNLPCVFTLVKTFPNKSQVKQQWQHGLTGWFIWVSPEKNNCFIWVWLCKIFTNSSVERGKELWRGSGRNEQVNCWFYHNVNKATENARANCVSLQVGLSCSVCVHPSQTWCSQTGNTNLGFIWQKETNWNSRPRSH